jgi:hypothetical protein
VAAWQVTKNPELVPFEIDEKQYKEKIAALGLVLYNFVQARRLKQNQEFNDSLSIGQNSLSDLLNERLSNG